MKQLNEKVAIVTGAGQGIGKGIALCLAKRGVKVIATGRRPDPINQTIAEIKELGGDGFAMTCDSADRARVEEVVKAAVDTYGTVDIGYRNHRDDGDRCTDWYFDCSGSDLYGPAV